MSADASIRSWSTRPGACVYGATSRPPWRRQRADQVEGGEQHKVLDELKPADMARMEREMELLSRDFREIEATHGKNVLNLVIVAGYLRKLLDNAPIVRYLAQHYPEIMTELHVVAETRSLFEAAESERGS